MVYGFDVRSAPRIALLPAIALFLLAGSVVTLLLLSVVAGIAALAVSAWLSFHLIRFTVTHIRSELRTSAEGISSLSSFGVETRMPWESVTHAGRFRTRRSDRYLFVYNEQADELLTIPSYYTNISDLESELRERSGRFLELSGEGPDDLGDALRPYLEE